MKVGNSLLPQWGTASNANNIAVRPTTSPVGTISTGFFQNAVSSTFDATLGTGYSLLKSVGKTLGLKILKTSILMSPILRRLNLIKPHLEGNEEYLSKVIAEYDKLDLASQALQSFNRHKLANPKADFITLKGSVFAELGVENAGKLPIAATHVLGSGLPESTFWEVFFEAKSTHLLTANRKKQDEILNKVFKPISEDIFPYWLPINYFQFPSAYVLDCYRGLKKATRREVELVGRLNELLYKGLGLKEDFSLPNGIEGDKVRQSNEFKKYLYHGARVDEGADFITNTLSVLASGLSLILEDFIHADKDAFGNILGLTSEHVKIALLKFLNHIASNNIDDISVNPNGKSSKELLGNLILNLSKIWDKHKETIHQQVKTFKNKSLNVRKRLINQKIFNDFSKDLLDMVGVNPLDDIDLLSEKNKTEYWKEDVQNDIVPEFLTELYTSLTQWEAEKDVNEKSLTSFSGYAVDAMNVISRRIVEGAQHYLANTPKAFSDNLSSFLKRKFESYKTISGNAAANYLTEKENVLSFKSVMDASLSILAKAESLWESVEEAVYPAIIKVTNELFSKIDRIEKKESNGFFRDTSLKLFKLFTKHYDIINSVQTNAGKDDATDLSKVDMITGMRSYKLSENSGGDIVQKRKYFDAKIRVFKAKESLDRLNTAHVKIAYIYDTSKKWFSFGQDFLGKKADAAIHKIEKAQKELINAEDALIQENSALRTKEMGRKLLDLCNLRSAADLPLPENLGSLRDDIWEALLDVGMPTMLQLTVDNMTDKDMVNTFLMKFIQTVKEPVKDLEKKDPEIENLRSVLEAIAFNSAQYKEGSDVAMQILDASVGLTLEKGIGKIMTTNPHATRILRLPIEKYSKMYPNVPKIWKQLISPKALQSEINIQDFHKSHKEFDGECGKLIKRMLKLIPLQFLHHVNIMNIAKIEDSAAENVGQLVRESLEPWTFKKMIDISLASMAESQMPNGKWDVEHARNISKNGKIGGIKRVFTKPISSQRSGYTRDYNLPISVEAKQEWDKKQAAEVNDRNATVRKELTEFLSYQFKGILESWCSTAWHSVLRIINKFIRFCFESNAPRLRDSLNKGVFYVATKIKTIALGIIDKVGFLLNIPVTFLLENAYVRFKADKMVRWGHMSYVHDELVWEMMETLINQAYDSANNLDKSLDDMIAF